VANSLLDGLAHSLRAAGIPAVSINWGALAESGVVARNGHLVGVLSSAGITGLTDREALEALERVLRRAQPQAGVFKVDWGRWLEAHPKLAEDPRFRTLCQQASGSDGSDLASQIRQSLAEASREQRLRALEDHLLQVLADTLKMATDAIPLDRKLNELGVDSLMVLELSLGIKERIGISFSAMEFLKGPNLQQLASMAEGKLWNN
jgi:acyl carrier protein